MIKSGLPQPDKIWPAFPRTAFSGFYSSLILTVVILMGENSVSQVPDTITRLDLIEITDKIENIAQSNDEVLDYSDLVEDLKYFKENPLNLNFAKASDLENLAFLSEMQIFNLIAYRETYGSFLTIFELQSIEGFDSQTIQKILPYITVSAEKPDLSFSLKELFRYGHHEALIRYQRVLQEQEGYAPVSDSALYAHPGSRYLGSPDKIYFKYGFNFRNRIKLGLITEKDAGEVFLTGHVDDSIKKLAGEHLKSGFDFYSANLSLQEFGVVKSLTIGDYQVSFGQGLTLSSGLAYTRSSEAVDIRRISKGVGSSVSANENLFFRGGAATVSAGHLDITAFFSSHPVDANLSDYDSLSEQYASVSSMNESGLHRTVSEIRDKQAVNIKAAGGHIALNANRLKLGLTGYYSRLGHPLSKASLPYRQFGFDGRENFNAGFDYTWLFRRVNFFGEIAYSRNGAFAGLFGLTSSIHPAFTFSLHYRNYPKDYQNHFSNAYAQGSSNCNEQGFYAGIRLQLPLKYTLTGYFDTFRFPWLRYRTDAPSSGNETMLKLQKLIGNDVIVYFSFRQSNRQVNEPAADQYTQALINTRISNYRFHIEYSILPSVTVKNRFEYSLYREAGLHKGTGYLIYQDVGWKDKTGKISLTGRYALFDTDSWDERIYAYENDVLYAFSVPAYYYKGSRCYLLIGYSISASLHVALRVANSTLYNQDTFGSGLDEIDGNNKTEIKFQLKLIL